MNLIEFDVFQRCEDVLAFYRIFQPITMEQYEKMGGKGNRAAEALIQLLFSAERLSFLYFSIFLLNH